LRRRSTAASESASNAGSTSARYANDSAKRERMPSSIAATRRTEGASVQGCGGVSTTVDWAISDSSTSTHTRVRRHASLQAPPWLSVALAALMGGDVLASNPGFSSHFGAQLRLDYIGLEIYVIAKLGTDRSEAE